MPTFGKKLIRKNKFNYINKLDYFWSRKSHHLPHKWQLFATIFAAPARNWQANSRAELL